MGDVRNLLDYLSSTNAQYTLAGGLAVSFWAEQLASAEEQTAFGVPLHSEDIDFRGYRFLADGIKAWMTAQGVEMGQINVAMRKGAEFMGKIYNLPFRPVDSHSGIQAAANVEILERLPLLDRSLAERPNGTVLTLAGIRVLDPFSLMICKLHAFHTRPPEEKGRDLHHLKILAAILPKTVQLCRERGIDLRADAARLLQVLESGEFPLPVDEASQAQVVRLLQEATVTDGGKAET